MNKEKQTPLVDGFGRTINYLRLSVTDRCNFRCIYCMSKNMTFLPRQQILSLEEMAFLSHAFVELGVNKIRLTGGEPLVRTNILSLVKKLGRMENLEELLLTTNGSRLEDFSNPLADAGLSRINVSLDSLKPKRFKAITRCGDLDQILRGIEKARQAGIKRIKINTVISRGENDDEILDLIRFVLENNLDISFIEEMPIGDIDGRNRRQSLVTSAEVRAMIGRDYELLPSTMESAGPSRYYQITGCDSRIGFISPNSHNFCDSCNRVRVTCEGRLLLCLGQEHSVDLRAVIRRYPGDIDRLKNVIIEGIALKPERHHFYHQDKPEIVRFMSATGG